MRHPSWSLVSASVCHLITSVHFRRALACQAKTACFRIIPHRLAPIAHTLHLCSHPAYLALILLHRRRLQRHIFVEESWGVFRVFVDWQCHRLRVCQRAAEGGLCTAALRLWLLLCGSMRCWCTISALCPLRCDGGPRCNLALLASWQKNSSALSAMAHCVRSIAVLALSVTPTVACAPRKFWSAGFRVHERVMLSTRVCPCAPSHTLNASSLLLLVMPLHCGPFVKRHSCSPPLVWNLILVTSSEFRGGPW